MGLLDAIEPAMVWGVVEATSKPEDITTWAERVGGVDALAVNGLADTSSPAAVLSTGVPVGLLDGEEATPLRWTSILSEHLELADWALFPTSPTRDRKSVVQGKVVSVRAEPGGRRTLKK